MVVVPDFKEIPVSFIISELSENKKKNIAINYYLSTLIKPNPFEDGIPMKQRLWNLAKEVAPKLCLDHVGIYQKLLKLYNYENKPAP